MQIIGRKDGRSAIRAAAYRAGQDLKDERTAEVHRFGQRRGVAHSEILLPLNTRAALADRQTLWNAVEQAEIRDDAQLAREVNIALPYELTPDQRLMLIRSYVLDEFVARGMIADLAIHVPRPGRGEDERNVHAHVMLTLRQGTPEGLRRVKTREWNARELLQHWRLDWERRSNLALIEAGFESRVNARSLVEQRAMALAEGDEPRARTLDRAAEIHMGPNVVEMARKAARTVSDGIAQQHHRSAPSIPDKVAENAERVDHNALRAWQRQANAQAAEARRARQVLSGPQYVSYRADGTMISYADLSARHERGPATGKVGKVIDRLRDTEISKQAVQVWRSTQYNLGDSDPGLADLLMNAQMRPVAKSPFRVTAKDLAFAFYRMGILSLDRLSTTLELIEAEQAMQHASARQDSFWSRIVPRARGQSVTRAQPLVRRRHRANDPKDP